MSENCLQNSIFCDTIIKLTHSKNVVSPDTGIKYTQTVKAVRLVLKTIMFCQMYLSTLALVEIWLG